MFAIEVPLKIHGSMGTYRPVVVLSPIVKRGIWKGTKHVGRPYGNGGQSEGVLGCSGFRGVFFRRARVVMR